jgi:poly(A) polymerase
MDELLARLSNPLLARVAQLLPTNEPVYLVGGAIRDAFLNREIYDLDFVTGRGAMRMARQLANELGGAYFPLDAQRKVARIVLKPGDLLENRKTIRIDFSAYQGEDLANDLLGRDFTINAMALEIHEFHTLIDPSSGAADLANKHLRTCTKQSFMDDPIRILRAVRLAVDLHLRILPETSDLIHEAVDQLPRVSNERIRDELFRILTNAHPGTSLRILDQFKALEYIVPEVCVLKNVSQSAPHVLDAWNHTIDIINRLETLLEVLSSHYNLDKANNLVLGLVSVQLGRYRQQLAEHLDNALNVERPHRGLLFLAALYHDVGKATTQTTVEGGRIKFINHEDEGRWLVEKRARALKLSNPEIDRLGTIVANHMRPSLLSHDGETPSRKVIYRFFRKTGAAGVDICILSLADLMATYGPSLPQKRWAEQVEVVRLLLDAWWEDQAGRLLPVPFINGDLLMKELELTPGPEVGFLLEAIREAQVAGEIQNPQEAVELAKKLFTKESKTG